MVATLILALIIGQDIKLTNERLLTNNGCTLLSTAYNNYCLTEVVKVKPKTSFLVTFKYAVARGSNAEAKYIFAIKEYSESDGKHWFKPVKAHEFDLKHNGQWNYFEKVIKLSSTTDNLNVSFDIKNNGYADADLLIKDFSMRGRLTNP